MITPYKKCISLAPFEGVDFTEVARMAIASFHQEFHSEILFFMTVYHNDLVDNASYMYHNVGGSQIHRDEITGIEPIIADLE